MTSVMKMEGLDRVWRNAAGQLHREDGPAIITAIGTKTWWINDKQHRLEGPARITAEGDKEWWVNDELHREDGPAIERADGGKYWYVNGMHHRVDGPAYVSADGKTLGWYLKGEDVTESMVMGL